MVAGHTDNAVVGHGRKLWSARSGPGVLHRQILGGDREEHISTGIRHENPFLCSVDGQVRGFCRDLGDLDELARKPVELTETLGTFT